MRDADDRQDDEEGEVNEDVNAEEATEFEGPSPER